MQMVEKEQNFRHAFLQKDQKRSFNIHSKGQWFAFFIMMAGLAFSYFLLEKGHEIMGSIFSGSLILVGAGMFIGRKLAHKEEVQK